MILSLRDVAEQPGAEIPFSCEIDLSEMEFPFGKPFPEPITARGSVKNTAGLLTLSAVMETTMHLRCDRCDTAYRRRKKLSVEITLADRLEDEADDEIYVFQGDQLALDEALVPVWILDMETKRLCREDCLGLCPRCGHNLNEGPCGCPPDGGDPRWAALKGFHL